MTFLASVSTTPETSQYMVIGYLILWAAIFVYAFALHWKTGALDRKLRHLDDAIHRMETAAK